MAFDMRTTTLHFERAIGSCFDLGHIRDFVIKRNMRQMTIARQCRTGFNEAFEGRGYGLALN